MLEKFVYSYIKKLYTYITIGLIINFLITLFTPLNVRLVTKFLLLK